MKKVIHKLFIVIIGTIAVLWPCGNAFAVDHSISPPQFSFVFASGDSTGTINKNSFCLEAGSDNYNSSSTDVSWRSQFYSFGTGSHSICRIGVRTISGGAITDLTSGGWAVITYVFQNSLAINYEFSLGELLGGSKKTPIETTPNPFFPVAILNQQNSVVSASSDDSSSYGRTVLTVLYRNSGSGGTANAYFYQNLNVPMSGSKFAVTNVFFYDNLDRAINDNLSKLNLSVSEMLTVLKQIQQNSSNSAVVDSINNQTDQQKDFRDQDKSDMQDAQNSANNSGEDAQADSERATGSLMDGLTGFVNAVKDANASKCTLTLNTNYGGTTKFGLGEVDLCQLSPPLSFQIISSVVIIGFSIPVFIAGIKLLLTLTWSFQR